MKKYNTPHRRKVIKTRLTEEAAPVVKQIYSLCLAGNGPTKIARMLTEQEIPTPGTLEYRRTENGKIFYTSFTSLYHMSKKQGVLS